jgi:uncharacterized protein (TIGR02145 family)
MRKLILTTATVATAIAVAFAAETAFGTFTDTRDGQTYKTVKIGKQTWMAQNLNYQTKNGSWCYKDSISYCKKYGRLYDWKTATTICPKGWELPDIADWNRLESTVGGEGIAGKLLKSKNGWNDVKGKSGNGTDNYRFSALPGGYRYSDGGFNDVGNSGYWWTATEYGSSNAYHRGMVSYNDGVDEDGNYKDTGYSVRCVAD